MKKIIISAVMILFCTPVALLAESSELHIQKIKSPDKKYTVTIEYNLKDEYKTVTRLIFSRNNKIKKLTMEFFNPVRKPDPFPYRFQDLNNDGEFEFVLLLATYPTGADYQYYTYSKQKKTFVNMGVFPNITYDNTTGKLSSSRRVSPSVVEHAEYELKNDQLVIISTSNM